MLRPIRFQCVEVRISAGHHCVHIYIYIYIHIYIYIYIHIYIHILSFIYVRTLNSTCAGPSGRQQKICYFSWDEFSSLLLYIHLIFTWVLWACVKRRQPFSFECAYYVCAAEYFFAAVELAVEERPLIIFPSSIVTKIKIIPERATKPV
jgi:hypothetical protein